MIDARITGQDQLRKLAAHLRVSGDKGLAREFAKALEGVADPVKRDITASAYATMPSGYRDELTRSMKHRRSTRVAGKQASVRIATYADGKKERRDLPALNLGELRHPVYGRTRRTKKGPLANPWAVTAVRAGFHQRGTEDAADRAEKALLGVIDEYTDRLAKG